jgi:hypothetical protein
MVISRSVILRMRSPDKSCIENQNAYLIFNALFPENRAVYELMWKNIVVPERSHMAFHDGVPKATNAYSEYAILIFSRFNNGCTKVPQCYVIRTLPVFFSSFLGACIASYVSVECFPAPPTPLLTSLWVG